MYFLLRSKKNGNFSCTSNGREKLIHILNKLQDGLLKGITNLTVIQYHSNGCCKPYTMKAQRKLEKRKRKEHTTENNEAELSVLVEQDRRSK